MLNASEKIITYVENMREIVNGNNIPSGKLIIGAHESQLVYRLTQFLKNFRSRYPLVQLVFQPLVSDENIREQLEHGILDVAFLLGPPFDIPGINMKPLVKENILIVAGTDHPLSMFPHIEPPDFSNATILTTEKGCAYREIFEKLLLSKGVRTGVKIEFSSIEAIKHCVIAGLGIAVLPEITIKKEIAQHKIAVLHCEGFDYSIDTRLAWHKGK